MPVPAVTTSAGELAVLPPMQEIELTAGLSGISQPSRG
jgi:hypothetical protein